MKALKLIVSAIIVARTKVDDNASRSRSLTCSYILLGQNHIILSFLLNEWSFVMMQSRDQIGRGKQRAWAYTREHETQ